MQRQATVPSLDQLTEASRRTADALESLRAELVGLRGRIEALEHHLEAAQAVQQQTAGRVEALAASVQRRGFDGLAGQVEAMREAHERTDHHIQQIAAEFARVNRMETTLSHLRDETIQQLDAREGNLRDAIGAQATQRIAEGRQIGRELQALAGRVEGLERLGQRVDALGRQHDETVKSVHQVVLRTESLGAEDARLEEARRHSDQRLAGEIADWANRTTALGDEVGAWRERLGEQGETVRAAHGLADQVRQEGERLQQAHRASAEAQRIATERVDAAVAAMRQDIEALAARLAADRQQHLELLIHMLDEREARLQADLAGGDQTIDGKLEELRAGLSAALALQATDLAQLQRLITAFVRGVRDQSAELADALGAQPPSADPTAVSAERRQALRRALRAQRGTHGG